jgi:hypothetical protein
MEFAGELAGELAGRFAAPGCEGTFLITLCADGSVASLTFVPPSIGWHRQIEELNAAGTPYLFYDPFDAPEYTWIGWSQIEQSAMERMMRQSFGPEDFIVFPAATSRAGELPQPEFPSTWGVMF